MQLIFVRHAQSANNVLFETEKTITRSEFESLRSHDPSLSDLGHRQAMELGIGIERGMRKRLGPVVRDLAKKSGRVVSSPRVHVAVSPMRRTLLTAAPMIKTLESMHADSKISLKSVEVVPFIFENGGCYDQI